MKKILQLLLKPVSLVVRVTKAVGRGLAFVGRPFVRPAKLLVRIALAPFKITASAIGGAISLSNAVSNGLVFLISKLQGVLYLTALYFIVSLGFNIYLKMQGGRILIKDLPVYQSLDILPNGTEIFEDLVKLYTQDGEFFCSGAVISNKYILTAGHCLDGSFAAGDIRIYNKQGLDSGVTGRAAAFNRRSDLGLILGDFTKFRKAMVSHLGIIGHHGPYATCGSPHNDTMICVPYEAISNADFFIAGKSFLYPGMSGGPVFDTTTGEIVAVNSQVRGSAAIVAPTVGVFSQFGIKAQ